MRTPESSAPGIYGYLILLGGVIAAFITLSPISQACCFLVLLFYALLFQRDAMARMARWPLAVFAAVLMLVASSDLALEAGAPIRISFSGPGAMMGLGMLMRACGIFIAAQIFSVRVPVLDLTRLTDAVGLRGFGFALGVAFHMLPEVHGTARETGDALRLRGLAGRRRWRAAVPWLLAILVQLLQRSDEIVASARTRGFGSGRRFRYFPAWRTGDAVILAVVSGTLLLAP